ncbi:DUF6056 family protein [Pontibacter sp. 13R65]|uniref:DUF6056 family protein n=1 Tax=Pontibacter sp. 13R65 TaxID=3127458 RepID=UPI00301BA67C
MFKLLKGRYKRKVTCRASFVSGHCISSEDLHASSKPVQDTQTFFLLLLLLGLLTLLPLLLLTAYNYPGADDFGFAVRDRTMGFWESQEYFYREWSGRYFATGIMRISPLVWGSIAGYKWLSALLLLAFGGALGWLAHVLFSGKLPWLQSSALAAFIFCLYVRQVPDITQSLFWLCGSLTYQLPSIMFLILLAYIARLIKSSNTGKNNWRVLVSAVLCVMIVGSNEMALLMTLSVLFLLVVACWQYREEHATHMAILFGVAFIAALVAVLAPGNYVRMSTHPRYAEFRWSIIYTSYLSLMFFMQWGGLLLIASVLYVPLWGYKLAITGRSDLLKQVDARWSVLLYLATIFVMQFLFTWSTSDKATPRVENVIYFYFVLGWFFNLQLILVQYPGLFKIRFFPSFKVAAFVLLVVFHFSLNEQVATAYLDLVSGKASDYKNEMESRFHYLATSDCEVCKVPPLSAIPATIVFKDLAWHKANQDYWVNKGYAAYWGKKEVLLTKPNNKAEANTVTLRELLQ